MCDVFARHYTTHLGGALKEAVEQEHSEKHCVLLEPKLCCHLNEPADGDTAELCSEVPSVIGEREPLLADALLLHPPCLHPLPRPIMMIVMDAGTCNNAVLVPHLIEATAVCMVAREGSDTCMCPVSPSGELREALDPCLVTVARVYDELSDASDVPASSETAAEGHGIA